MDGTVSVDRGVGGDVESDFTTRQVKFTTDAKWARLCVLRRRWDRLFAGHLTAGDVPLNTNHWQR